MKVKRNHRNLQDFCRVMRSNVPGRVSEAAGLDVKLMNDTTVTSSPDADKIVDPHIDELMRQLASTRAEVVLLMAKLSDLEDVLQKVERVHERPV